jgi:hypothetical protein
VHKSWPEHGGNGDSSRRIGAPEPASFNADVSYVKTGGIAGFGRDVLRLRAMENQDRPASSKVHHLKRARRYLSSPRLVMGLLLIIAIPIFISLANKAVNENAEAIRQTFGH